MKKIITISLISILFPIYYVGDTVSISDQQQVLDVCNGVEPNGELDGEMTMYDYNGRL